MDLERNYKDFTKEIKEVESYLDGSFENQSIDNLKSLYSACESLISEYIHISSDIEEAISIIDNIED